MSIYQTNPAVVDSICQVQTAVLGAAPALAAGMMQLQSASAAGLMLHNAVFQQQLLNSQGQASALVGLRLSIRGPRHLAAARRVTSGGAAPQKRTPAPKQLDAAAMLLLLRTVSRGSAQRE